MSEMCAVQRDMELIQTVGPLSRYKMQDEDRENVLEFRAKHVRNLHLILTSRHAQS